MVEDLHPSSQAEIDDLQQILAKFRIMETSTSARMMRNPDKCDAGMQKTTGGDFALQETEAMTNIDTRGWSE